MTSRKRYQIPAGQSRVTHEVKGSRFIATAAHAPDLPTARRFVAEIKDEFRDATHNCWAWVVGPPGSTGCNGSSDDGEPGGTAGLPILNVLLNSGVGDVVAVVSRYYGGTKLGRGGLARAYGGSAQRAIRDLELTERIFYVDVEVTADYNTVDAVRRAAEACDGVVAAETFGEKAVFELMIPEERVVDFELGVRDATGGRSRVRRVDK
jgi:uncharacterized YigZ family protein